MAFNCMLFRYTKKKNSTARPDNGDGHIYTCEIKDGCDLLQPVFVFNFGEDEQGKMINPRIWTYARITEFGRYYYIENWTWASGVWIASMKVDAMATYKEEIGISTMYVLRSASSYDRQIVDTKYPTIAADETQVSEQVVSPWKYQIGNAPSVTDGFYLVGIVNADVNAIGTVAYYAFSEPAMRGLLEKLYDSPSWLNITDTSLSTDLQKMLLNPMQYITTAMWIPYPLYGTTIADRVTDLKYGWWSITLRYPCFRLSPASAFYTFTQDMTIPRHPQSVPVGSETQYRDWLNLAPYTQYALEFYPFGMIPLDSSKLLGADKIRLEVKLDYITGKGTLRILKMQRATGNNSEYALSGAIYSTTAQVGIPIAIAQMSVDMAALGQASTWITGAGLGIASSNSITGTAARTTATTLWNKGMFGIYAGIIRGGKAIYDAIRNEDITFSDIKDYFANGTLTEDIKQAGSDIGNAVAAVAGTCQSQGATGAFAQYSLPIILTAYIMMLAPQDNEHFGSPLCRKVAINTLSGYTQVADASAFVATDCLPAEADVVRAYMEGGFYYE